MGKKPFSGKQKRDQLKAKRLGKQDRVQLGDFETGTIVVSTDEPTPGNARPAYSGRGVRATTAAAAPEGTTQTDEARGTITNSKDKKLNTVFERESKVELDKRIKQSMSPYTPLPANALQLTLRDCEKRLTIDMPKRPPWSAHVTKQELERGEEIYFKQFLKNIYDNYPRTRLNYFEHNLEVWRQLWRVIELSDILLMLVDSRHPVFHFPPSLFNYVTVEKKKPLVLVLTKVDVISDATLQGWINYFTRTYPGIHVVPFTTTPRNPDEPSGEEVLYRRRKKKKEKKKSAVGVENLLEACHQIYLQSGGDANVEWVRPIEEEEASSAQQAPHISDLINAAAARKAGKPAASSESAAAKGKAARADKGDDEEADDDDEEDDDSKSEEGKAEAEVDTDPRANDGHQAKVTIGLCGHPNVGKSALMNGLMGKHVVSVKRTPGHTKHFQTHFFNDNVRLCDCPGLVFPALDMPKAMQVICGVFPIAQVAEPFSAIQYLAERLPLPQLYGLTPPPIIYAREDGSLQSEGELLAMYKWSAWDICESYALKRGFWYTSGRPDTHRAAQAILYDTIDGRLALVFKPPYVDGTTTMTIEGAGSAPRVAESDEGSEAASEDEEEEATPASRNMFALLDDDDN